MQLAANVNAAGTAFLAHRGLLAAFPAAEVVVASVPLAAKGDSGAVGTPPIPPSLQTLLRQIMQRVFKAFQGAFILPRG